MNRMKILQATASSIFLCCLCLQSVAQEAKKAEPSPIVIGKERVVPFAKAENTAFIDAEQTSPRVTPVAVTNTIAPPPAAQVITIQPLVSLTAESLDLPGLSLSTPVAEAAMPAPAPSPAPILSPEEKKARTALLRDILVTATAQANQYNQIFRDLSASETRLSEQLEGDNIRKKRTVENDLVVYQSRLDEKMVYEFRSAKTIDGKALKVDEKRLEKLFQKLLKTNSTRQELDLLNDVGFENDLEIGGHFYGLTLVQWREISAWALPDVGFDILGRDKIKGKDVVVVYYQQMRPNKQLEWTLPKLRGFERAQQFTRGVLWLDATTMQIRRGERELTLLFPNEKEPVRVWKQTMNYQESPHGILVPSQFVAEYFYFFGRGKDGKLMTIPSGRLTSTFGEFKRFNVTSEEEKKKTIIKEK